MKLETERLILREWERPDLDDLVEGLGDLAVAQWLASVPHRYTVNHATSWLAYCATNAKKEPRESYDFAIVPKSVAKVIGGVSLDRIDRLNGIAGGGIWLNARYHNRGYGTEAFAARLEFAFERLQLRRIENGFLEGNQASRKMLERLGYKMESARRKRLLCMADGRVKDECSMALLKEDWRKRDTLIYG
jgi:RimJ/RimL family protein N-acetyltransferase